MLKRFVYFIIMIEPVEFDKCISIMRTFFKVKGFVEVHTQSRLSILAYEDPQTITTFQYANQIWPLPQTAQMWLDYEMLKDPSSDYFCVSTCYRNSDILPMFEFELKGGLDKMIDLERQLLEFIGFKSKDAKYPEVEQYQEDLGDVFFLKHFPNHMPFWNMKQKVDVMIHGVETICSAERLTDPIEIRNQFNNNSNILYNTFGKRLEDELELFLNHRFIQRSGGGIDISRMIQAMKLSNLM